MHETRRMRKLISRIEICLQSQPTKVKKLLSSRKIIKSMAEILLYPNEVGNQIHGGLRSILQSYQSLSLLGWTQEGVRFGSVAADIHSFFGNLKVGSYFSQLQSITARHYHDNLPILFDTKNQIMKCNFYQDSPVILWTQI